MILQDFFTAYIWCHNCQKMSVFKITEKLQKKTTNLKKLLFYGLYLVPQLPDFFYSVVSTYKTERQTAQEKESETDKALLDQNSY